MRSFWYAATAALLTTHICAAADEKKEDAVRPCTIRSSASGNFYDLNPIAVMHHDADHKAGKDEDVPVSYKARGHDYAANFTLNFCAPVVEALDGVVGVEVAYWKNVSAYYESGGKVYSIGSVPPLKGMALRHNRLTP